MREAFQKEIDKTGYDEPNALGAVACEAAYRGGQEWLDQLRAYLLENLNFLRAYLQEKLPQIHLVEPEGTYLVWLDCSELGIYRQGTGSVYRRESGTLAGWRSNVRTQWSRLPASEYCLPQSNSRACTGQAEGGSRQPGLRSDRFDVSKEKYLWTLVPIGQKL